MPVQHKIRITKEIIEHCKNCGTENSRRDIGSNCAVAFALKDIFPDVYVTDCYILPFGTDTAKGKNIQISMPVIAQQFIKLFDGFYLMPNLRVSLPEFEFTINIPDEVLDLINIDEVEELIKGEKKTADLL
ncbi:MAG TPA: hypothetical protein VFW07_00260 [Parafilimonas sp.]|nr:hypothetical protein [Parafilimonas sp.]